MAGSLDQATNDCTVDAWLGKSAQIVARHAIAVDSLFNLTSSGSMTPAVTAHATGSAGSLLAGILVGADARATTNVGGGARVGASANPSGRHGILLASGSFPQAALATSAV